MLYKVDPGLSSDADMYIKSICTGNTVGHIEHIGQKYCFGSLFIYSYYLRYIHMLQGLKS